MSEWQFYVTVGTIAAGFVGLWVWALIISKPGLGLIDVKDRHGPDRGVDE